MIPIQLSQVIDLPDVITDNHFDLFLPFIPGGGDADQFSVRNMTAALDGKSHGTTKITLHRQDVNFANRAKFPQTFQATYIDSTDRKVLSAFENWENQITDPNTGLPRPKSFYTVDGNLHVYDSNNRVVEKRVYKNLWVSNVTYSQLNGNTENSPLQISATFTYDYWTKF
jgi:hypothetical protein